ncbi:hypothetical protein [Amycolatopsis sp. NPDC051372]|uniref:hypothetical protein n=1 Tax=Amycolatopsis sp. NPDC051372 TaxID=3155669 RepID=UPI003429EDE4
MTSIAMRATGASFGGFDKAASWKVAGTGDAGGWGNTRLRNVENPSIRDALTTFDAALAASSSFLLLVSGRTRGQTVEIVADHDIALDWLIETDVNDSDTLRAGESLEKQPAVAVVEQLVTQLGIPKRDVLRAAGISKSTYHSWCKPNRPRPRVNSQGQLWALVEAVNDLAENLGAADRIAPWLLADARRKSLLRDGQFDQLIALASPLPSGDGVAYLAGTFAAGQEKLEPIVSTATSARTRVVNTDSSFERVIKNVRRPH